MFIKNLLCHLIFLIFFLSAGVTRFPTRIAPIDYFFARNDAKLTHTITEQIYSVLKKYSDEIQVDHFRLIENGSGFCAAFDMVYPAELQKREDEIRNSIAEKVRSENPECHLTIRSIIRRERLSLHR